MAGRSVAVVFLFTFALSWVHAGKLPSYVKPCKKSDLQYDACLVRLVENLRPRLSTKGIPIIGVPLLEPFVLPRLDVVEYLYNIKVRALLQNIVAYGGKDFVINRLKTDVDKLAAEGTITLPFLLVKANYDVFVPLRSTGVFIGNFTGIKVDMKGEGKIIKMNGENYIQINNIKLKIKVEDFNVKMIKPFYVSELLQPAISSYQKRKQLLEMIMPIVQKKAEEVIGQIGNRILASAPMSELLPA